MHFDGALNLSVLITIALAILRLIYQTGGMQQAFRQLTAEVEEGGRKLERYITETAEAKAAVAALEGRVAVLERWRERKEPRD